MKIYNRQTKQYEDNIQYGGRLLEFLYHHKLGRVFLKFVIHPYFSRLYGWYQKSPLSRKKIDAFVKEYSISLEDYESTEYKSFYEFFVRKIKKDKRPVDRKKESFIAPCDGKLLVYEIGDERVKIKGESYLLTELVDDKLDISDYEGGQCLVFRLSMDDYHRYSFVDAGVLKGRFFIRGKLHTVSSISKGHRIYRQNSRVVNVLKCKNFGDIIWIEVGALLVGKIKNHPIRTFRKGTEKGFFEPGGSTIVLLIKKGQLVLDKDIVYHSKKGMEVRVRLGEKIGTKGNEEAR